MLFAFSLWYKLTVCTASDVDVRRCSFVQRLVEISILFEQAMYLVQRYLVIKPQLFLSNLLVTFV